jgi:hypothetical protein
MNVSHKFSSDSFMPLHPFAGQKAIDYFKVESLNAGVRSTLTIPESIEIYFGDDSRIKSTHGVELKLVEAYLLSFIIMIFVFFKKDLVSNSLLFGKVFFISLWDSTLISFLIAFFLSTLSYHLWTRGYNSQKFVLTCFSKPFAFMLQCWFC